MFKNAILITSTLAATTAFAGVTSKEVVNGYANLAYANYSDAFVTAKALQQDIRAFVAHPSAKTLEQAKTAWLASRPSYQQSEVFRFSNPVVDDWEGQLNAWPLDEGLIDYIDTSAYEYELGNEGGKANIIANAMVGDINAQTITTDVLVSLNEFGGSEANVATGYHAIEFLLWGQDLNGHHAGTGNRAYTDYLSGDQCTNGHCDRRGQYLVAAADLLVNDLEYMVGQWAKGEDNYRAELLAHSAASGLNKMLYGMGSLALGELAGERIKVALTANSAEDEHDCFSDNTHNSHYYNAQGIANLYFGTYTSSDNQTTKVPSLRSMLLLNGELALVQKADDAFIGTKASLLKLVNSANAGVAFDQLISPNNATGKALLNSIINNLVNETSVIEDIAQVVGIESLSPDNADHDF